MILLPNEQECQGIISVCGSAQTSPNIYEMAVCLGKKLARSGFIVACGGLFGVMEAVCQGAKLEGGFTIGILPGLNKKDANPYVDLRIPTGMGEARNNVVVSIADGVIIVAGESGTLSEIAIAWRLKKPIIALTSSGGWAERLTQKKIDDTRTDMILGADSPENAVKMMLKLLKTS